MFVLFVDWMLICSLAWSFSARDIAVVYVFDKYHSLVIKIIMENKTEIETEMHQLSSQEHPFLHQTFVLFVYLKLTMWLNETW